MQANCFGIFNLTINLIQLGNEIQKSVMRKEDVGEFQFRTSADM